MEIGSDVEQGFSKIAREAVTIYTALEDKHGKRKRNATRSGAGVGTEDGRGNMN